MISYGRLDLRNCPLWIGTHVSSPLTGGTRRELTKYTDQKESEMTPLVLINGYIHDVSGFEEKHPGGRSILMRHVGKDASSAFSGGVYEHSNAAHNVSIS